MKKIIWEDIDKDAEYLVVTVRSMVDNLNSVKKEDIRRMRRVLRAVTRQLNHFDELTKLADELT